MKHRHLQTVARQIREHARDRLEALQRQENHIIAAALHTAHAQGWSVLQCRELFERLDEQIRDVNGTERLHHTETLHNGGFGDAEGIWADRKHR